MFLCRVDGGREDIRSHDQWGREFCVLARQARDGKGREIEVIRKFLNEYENVMAEPLDLQPDSKVLVRQGLFMDKEATVIKVQGNKVRVVIESIGYSLVALVDKKNLELKHD